MKYVIDFEEGIAHLYTQDKDWEERFYHLANQCFGIRKSIAEVELLCSSDVNPTGMIPKEVERLEHSGDLIIWDKEGNKIKSEWDEF